MHTIGVLSVLRTVSLIMPEGEVAKVDANYDDWNLLYQLSLKMDLKVTKLPSRQSTFVAMETITQY